MTKPQSLPSTTCRICGTPIQAFMTFGRMPIANGFLSPAQFAGEYFFELAPALCPTCKMFQLVEQPDPGMMFHDNYAFVSGTSRGMTRHFADFAAWVQKDLPKDAFVVEIGSNDGIMLKNFAAAGVRHLGVEPSGNVADMARAAGVNTVTAFFDEAQARRLVQEYGQADALLAANVMCHIPTLTSVLRGAKLLLKPQGRFCFEDPYLGQMMEKTSYDQIYDEHVFIFSALSIAAAAERCGLALVDVLPQTTHGGSMRYVLAHAGTKASDAVTRTLAEERRLGLDRPETCAAFRDRCEQSRKDLVGLIRDLRAKGKRVVGYAATSKSTTVLNYCGLGPDDIEYISDTTPLKQGRYTPGMHIPVRSPDEFHARVPEYAVLFGWNHEAEILGKEKAFSDAGGRWIKFVPRVGVA